VEAPEELEEAVSSKVVFVKAALRLLAAAHAPLKARLPLFDPQLELPP
jgi:hypothetical protein